MDDLKAVKLQRTVAALPHLDKDACLDILQGVNWNVEQVISMFGGEGKSPTPPLNECDWPTLSAKQKINCKNFGQLSLSTKGSPAAPSNSFVHTPLRKVPPTLLFSNTPLPPETPDSQGLLNFKRILPGMSSNFLKDVLDAELKFESNRELLFAVQEETAKILILMRGVPGSGKSTLAKIFLALSQHGVSHSADDYFINSHGVYNFKAENIQAAHSSAQHNCRESLRKGITPIIIDNTNTQAWEMTPYVMLAIEYGYEVRIVEPNTPWRNRLEILAKKNSHNVPKKKIQEMLGRYHVGITVDKLMRLAKVEMQKGRGKRVTSAPTRENAKVSDAMHFGRENFSADTKSGRSVDRQNRFSSRSPVAQFSSLTLRDVKALSTSPRTGLGLNESGSDTVFLEESETSRVFNDNFMKITSTTDAAALPLAAELEKDNRVEERENSPLNEHETSHSEWTNSPSPNVSPEVDNQSLLTQTLNNQSSDDDSNEIESTEMQQKMKRKADILQNLFPHLNSSYLDDLFQKSNGDLAWCVDILISSEYVMSGDHHGERVTALKFGNLGEILSPDDEVYSKARSKSSHGSDERAEIPIPQSKLRRGMHRRHSFSSGELEAGNTLFSTDRVEDGRAASQWLKPEVRVQPELFEPIDGVDWVELELNQSFLSDLSQLYPNPFEEELKVPQNIRIPPTLAFELYKYILLNEAYRKNVLSTEVGEGEEGELLPFNRSPEPNTLALLLRMGKLKAAFPGVEEKIIRNVYSSNNANYDITLTELKERFGYLFNPGGLTEEFSCIPSTSIQKRRNSLPARGNRNEESGSYSTIHKLDVGSDVTNSTTIQKWRHKAYEASLKRNEYVERLKRISRRSVGAAGLAEYLREHIDLYTQEMDEANGIALELTMKSPALTTVVDDTVLDLHFLFVKEAISELQKYLTMWNKRLSKSGGGKILLSVITGKGKNSGVFGPRIRPSVVDFLKANHYNHHVYDGIVFVTMDVKQ